MSRRQQRRPPRPLHRRTGTRRENRRLLVVTEGKTEKEYLEGLMQSLRPAGTQVISIDVVDGKGEPGQQHDQRPEAHSAVDGDKPTIP